MPERRHFRGRSAPPWWPDGETWPPQRGEWHAMRRRFFRRVGLALIALFGTLVALAAVGWAIWGDHRNDGGPPGNEGWDGPPIFFFVFLLAGAFLIYRF